MFSEGYFNESNDYKAKRTYLVRHYADRRFDWPLTKTGSNSILRDAVPLRNLKSRCLRSVCRLWSWQPTTLKWSVLLLCMYMKIDAGLKVKTTRTWLCFQRPCALVVSADVRVTMRITLFTRKCPAVRFALFWMSWRCTVQRYLHYEGLGWGQISRKKRYVPLVPGTPPHRLDFSCLNYLKYLFIDEKK